MADDASEEMVGLHVKVPKPLYARLIERRDQMRKTKPMANFSEAVREVLERGLRRTPK